jgi:hypothetical protein
MAFLDLGKIGSINGKYHHRGEKPSTERRVLVE